MLPNNNAGNIYTSKALILLSDDSVYFECSRIKCARFKGNDVDEFIDQKEFQGALYEQVENAMNFAKQYIARSGKIEDIQRKDKYEIPLVAIREALINAVVHRDYSIEGSDIKFAIFDDRIEITSPGCLPKSLDIDDIKEGRSEIRNRVIARFFKEINYIEQWGTGIRRIISECTKVNLKEPYFKESGNFFKIIIYKYKEDKAAISGDKVAISGDKIKENERIILEYIDKHLFVNNSLVRELLNMSSSGARKLLNNMVKKELIIAEGSNRDRIYKKA